jgi:hypothetical protein
MRQIYGTKVIALTRGDLMGKSRRHEAKPDKGDNLHRDM